MGHGDGESDAERRLFGYAGTYLLLTLALFGAACLMGGIREVAHENRSVGVFPAEVLVTQKAPEYEVAFTGFGGLLVVIGVGGASYRLVRARLRRSPAQPD